MNHFKSIKHLKSVLNKSNRRVIKMNWKNYMWWFWIKMYEDRKEYVQQSEGHFKLDTVLQLLVLSVSRRNPLISFVSYEYCEDYCLLVELYKCSGGTCNVHPSKAGSSTFLWNAGKGLLDYMYGMTFCNTINFIFTITRTSDLSHECYIYSCIDHTLFSKCSFQK